MTIRHSFSALLVCLYACAGTAELSDQERAKLDHDLVRLLTESEVPDDLFDVTFRRDGTKEYGVIVRAASAEEIRKAGIRVVSTLGDLMTVRATRDQLRTLVSLPSVRSMECGSRNLHH